MALSNDTNLYSSFRRSLQALQTQAVQANPDVSNLQAEFLTVQQYYQMRILSAELLEREDAGINLSRLMSYQTEMSKELRLLGMDIMFLQTAKKAMSVQQRQSQVRDRLERLIGYCDRIVELLTQT